MIKQHDRYVALPAVFLTATSSYLIPDRYVVLPAVVLIVTWSHLQYSDHYVVLP